MERCSDIFYTGWMIKGDRSYPAMDTTEMLYEKKLISWGTIKNIEKGSLKDWNR